MKSVTNIDAVDKDRFDTASEHVPQSVKSLAANNETASDLLADTFGMLYKYSPMLQDSVDTDRQLNKHILQEMTKLAEYKQLRNFTVGDVQNAAAATDIVKPIWDAIPDAVKESQQNSESIDAQIDEALDSEEYDPEVLKKLFNESQQATDELGAQIAEHSDAIRQAVRRGLAEKETETADTEQAIACLGWGREGGETQPTTAQDKLKIAQALKHSKKLQDIIKMAGRMTNMAQKKQHQKVNYLRTEITGIEQGDDLSATLPSEFGYLMHESPALNTLFMKRLSQAELMQYEMQDREKKAQGPVIVLIDCSGSMSGEPDIWSKSCALAMYSIARKQHRDFSVLLFTTEVEHEVYIKKGEHKPADLMAILTAGVGGGTSFEQPLGRAVELIKTETHKQADVIVITDGVCDISESFKLSYEASKKDLQFSTYSILIGGSKEEERIAKKFSDTVTLLNDMLSQNEGQAFDVVFNI